MRSIEIEVPNYLEISTCDPLIYNEQSHLYCINIICMVKPIRIKRVSAPLKSFSYLVKPENLQDEFNHISSVFCSENVVYFFCLLHLCSTALQTNLITEVNTIKPDQTALMGAQWLSGRVLTRAAGLSLTGVTVLCP